MNWVEGPPNPVEWRWAMSIEIDDEESMDEDTSPQGDVQVKGKFIRTLPGMLQYNVEAEPTEWLWRLQCAHKLLKEEDSRAFIFDPDISRDAFFSIVYQEPDLLVSKDLEGTDIVRAEACREASSILSKQSVSEVEEIMNAKGCYPFPAKLSEAENAVTEVLPAAFEEIANDEPDGFDVKLYVGSIGNNPAPDGY
ncbi:hypothetical protein ACEPAF_8054 [Sanghuangporus sanghuang]